MLQRSLRHSLRTPGVLTSPPSTPSHLCKCRCGTAFNPIPTPDTRSHPYATQRKSPAAISRERHHRSLPSYRKERLNAFDDVLRKFIRNLCVDGTFPYHPDTLQEFLDKAFDLCNQALDRPTADPVRFRELMKEYDVSIHYIQDICDLLFAFREPERARLINRLMITLSRLGSARATLQIMTVALSQQKRKPGTLRSSELTYARAHLTQLAAEKHLYRAVVLEGKVARALGHEDRAIALWTQAINTAVSVADAKSANHDFQPDRLELSSPWIELMLVYNDRCQRGKNEMDKLQWAIDIGCRQDDPMSHYYAATFFKSVTPDGTHTPTSDWLYHMTKAAASNHQKAIHELANFYAYSGWKYIEDEPPDEIKPTPFDSYPKPKSMINRVKSVWNFTRDFLGWKPARDEETPRDSIFHSAAFPFKAKDRYELALQWLRVNESYYYAPSYLLHAKLLMQKTLWGQADAPQSALQLHRDRYTYTSKEKKEAETPIAKRSQPEPVDPPNPYYDLEKAKHNLREVFYAYHAHVRLVRERTTYEMDRRRGLVVEMDEDELKYTYRRDGAPERVTKWYEYPEVREMYEDEMEELFKEAKEICDEEGWDIVDDGGALQYKAKVKRGPAVRS